VRAGSADPEDVDRFLRQGTRAYLAGDYVTARGVFETLLPPIGDATIDLGQHEMVDEVLTVEIHTCATQYVVSVYWTTALEARAEAIHRAMDAVRSVALIGMPIREMELVATAPLPDLDAFLPRWLRYLERSAPPKDKWDYEGDARLREAAMRVEGVPGLERLARETRKPEALSAWCSALFEAGDWSGALRACEAAAEMSREAYWRGDFLDDAALAAKQLGHSDADLRLEAAWRGAPSLQRLQRWLGAGSPEGATVVDRAKQAFEHCPRTAGRQRGLLCYLTGDARRAAALLARAPGLGWSDEEHPGHLLFSAFAAMLTEGSGTTLDPALWESLRERSWTAIHGDGDWGDPGEDDGTGRTGGAASLKLDTPSAPDLFALARPGIGLDSRDRAAVLKAMRAAATKRTQGVLANKRRRHYGHAAALVACCLQVSSGIGEQDSALAWIEGLRKEYSRFAAFRGELKTALGWVSLR